MKTIIWGLITIAISASGCNTDCKEDILYKRKFDQNINLIKRTSHDTLLVQDIRNAVIFLNATTGIEAEQIDIENGVFYTETALEKNIGRWEKWYRINKCSITMVKADSLLKTYK